MLSQSQTQEYAEKKEAERINGPTYINRFGQGQRKTVAEFDTHRKALAMIREYRISDPNARYSLSCHCCAGWND